MYGDWGKVREELGVKGLGLEMPEQPYDSLRTLRLGCAELSKRVFDDGDLDEDAMYDCIESAGRGFETSPEGEEVIERFNGTGWFATFLEYVFNYCGQSLEDVTPTTAEEILLDLIPRKVAVEADRAEEVVFELIKFWEYLGSNQELPNAPAIVHYLKKPKLREELRHALSDQSNFGMAKSIFSAGNASGFDMSTQEGVDSFVAAYNAKLRQTTESPEVPPPHVGPSTIRTPAAKTGRNAPCPCGSGKKFKKCCR